MTEQTPFSMCITITSNVTDNGKTLITKDFTNADVVFKRIETKDNPLQDGEESIITSFKTLIDLKSIQLNLGKKKYSFTNVLNNFIINDKSIVTYVDDTKEAHMLSQKTIHVPPQEKASQEVPQEVPQEVYQVSQEVPQEEIQEEVPQEEVPQEEIPQEEVPPSEERDRDQSDTIKVENSSIEEQNSQSVLTEEQNQNTTRIYSENEIDILELAFYSCQSDVKDEELAYKNTKDKLENIIVNMVCEFWEIIVTKNFKQNLRILFKDLKNLVKKFPNYSDNDKQEGITFIKENRTCFSDDENDYDDIINLENNDFDFYHKSTNEEKCFDYKICNSILRGIHSSLISHFQSNIMIVCPGIFYDVSDDDVSNEDNVTKENNDVSDEDNVTKENNDVSDEDNVTKDYDVSDEDNVTKDDDVSDEDNDENNTL